MKLVISGFLLIASFDKLRHNWGFFSFMLKRNELQGNQSRVVVPYPELFVGFQDFIHIFHPTLQPAVAPFLVRLPHGPLEVIPQGGGQPGL